MEQSTKTLVYPARIAAEQDGFVVTFCDLINIFTEGGTYEDAIFKACEVLDLLLLEMVRDGLEIPNPSKLRKNEVGIAVSPEVAVPVLLHKLRKEKNYSMAEVAGSMGVKYQTYQQIENGKNITLRSLKKAAAALGAMVEIKFYYPKTHHFRNDNL